jgi:hypothetical protein
MRTTGSVSFAIVALIALVLGGGPSTHAAGTAADTSQTETRIRVVFFPITGAPNDAVRHEGQDELGKLVARLNATNPLYFACLQTPNNAAAAAAGPGACDASRANIIVSTTLTSAKDYNLALAINSIDVTGSRFLGSIQKNVGTKNTSGTVDDKTTGTALRKALELSDDAVHSLLGVPVAANKPPDDTSRNDTRIRVVFFPIAGAPDDSVRHAGQAELINLVSAVNAANALYFACLQTANAAASAAAGSGTCDASRAGIIVSTTLRKAKDDNLALVLGATDLAGHRTLGTVQKDIATKNAANQVDDKTTGDAVTKALRLSDDEIRSLIGTPVVRDGQLSTQGGSQPFVQLIPDISSSDPTYVALLQNLLAKRGIASVPSQFNAGTVTSGNVGEDALCGLGQRYLVYSVAKRTEDRPLSFNTRIETRAFGHLYDCPTRTDLAFGDTARTFATNTKQSLGGFLALLGSLFVSKNNSWQNAATTGALVTTAFDVAPEKIQDHTAEITLQKLVDSFCDRIKTLPTPQPVAAVVQETLPTPTPKPTAKPTTKPTAKATKKPQAAQNFDFLPPPASSGTSAKANASQPASTSQTTNVASTGGASDASVPLDIGNFLANAPPKLGCGPPAFHDRPTPPPYRSIFHRNS